MSTTPSEPAHRVPHDPHDRSALTAAWLKALAPTGFTSMARADFDRLIATHVTALVDALATDPVTIAAGHRAGAALVDASFTDAESLRATLRVLAGPLLSIAEADGRPDPHGRAFALI